jgi:hypothetical protein
MTSNEKFAINSPIFLVREKVIWWSLLSVYVWPGFKGKRKWGLILTLYKKTFRYRLPVSRQGNEQKKLQDTKFKIPINQDTKFIKKNLFQFQNQAGKREN